MVRRPPMEPNIPIGHLFIQYYHTVTEERQVHLAYLLPLGQHHREGRLLSGVYLPPVEVGGRHNYIFRKLPDNGSGSGSNRREYAMGWGPLHVASRRESDGSDWVLGRNVAT